MKLDQSIALRERARHCCPTSSPFSKDAIFYGSDDPNAYPQFLARAKGSRVWDADGNEYIDWVSGLGATILGHGHEAIVKAVSDVIQGGVGLSLPHVLEVEVAEKLAAFSPLPEAQVRFCKTGSDACAAAVRLARAVTGRERILSVGYHGWHDTFVAATPPAWGVPVTLAQTVRNVALADLPRTPLDKSTAAVIIEHGLDDLPRDFYRALLQRCHEAGALLIMDEVVTGFRWPKGSVAHAYGFVPDLLCYGKALANGYPLAALVGPPEHMQWFWRNDPVFVSTTFAGEPVALAAANAVLYWMNDGMRAHIATVGGWLQTWLNDFGKGLFRCDGHPCRSLVTFPHGDGWLCRDEETAFLARGLFVQEMAKQGVIMHRPNFPTLSHFYTDFEKTCDAAYQASETVRNAIECDTLADVMAGRRPRQLFSGR